MTKVKKAVFPVGGLGTRFLPISKSLPKEMLPIIDKPLIAYAVEEAKAAGIEEFIFVTSRDKSALEDYFDHNTELNAALAARGKTEEVDALNELLPEPGQIIYTRQQEPLGLGHAVWCARHIVGDEPFAVILPDDLIFSKKSCLKQMVEAYDKTGGTVVAAMDVHAQQTPLYGILDVKEDKGSLVSAKGVVEKPMPQHAPSTVAVVGRYIIPPQIFKELDKQECGFGGEIQLTDALAALINDFPFHGLRFEGKRFDCGTREGWLSANLAFALARSDLREYTQNLIQRHQEQEDLKKCV